MAPDSDVFTCKTCGGTHAGLATDFGFTLPDEVWSLSAEAKAARAQFDADLCRLDDRYFIRCVLEIPFTEASGHFGWGIWVEVEAAVFRRYLDLYRADATGEPPYPGKISNAFRAYRDTIGLAVSIQFQDSKSRPTVYLPIDSQADIALEQKTGMDALRFHQVLEINAVTASRKPEAGKSSIALD